MALVETVIRDLCGVETESPLVRVGVVVNLDAVTRRVDERVDGQQPGVAVANPRNLRKEKIQTKL